MQYNNREDHINKHDAGGGTKALPYPTDFARAQILTAIGGHGHAKVLVDAGEEIFYAKTCGKGSHTDCAQGIVGRLNHDAADGGDGELQSHGNALPEQVAGKGGIIFRRI